MSKRKASTDILPTISPSQRPRTRSDVSFLETHPHKTPTRTSPRKKTTVGDSSKVRSAISVHETFSLKGNDGESSDNTDELNLTPSITPRGRAANVSRRVILDSVEVIIPRYRNKMSQQDVGSPVAMRSKHDYVHREEDTPPSTPPKKRVAMPSRPEITSPSKTATNIQTSPESPQRLPRALPAHLYPCLNAQKRVILAALQNPPGPDMDTDMDEGPPTNTIASQQLSDLLTGTVNRGEGNSCLILGPRGSGKTRLVEQTIDAQPDHPIIIRLSGWAQQNDRLAMREIARQLTQQTGSSFLKDIEGDDIDTQDSDDSDNPFHNSNSSVSLPPPSHLPALISVLPTLSRPTIVVLDAFDLFALHARQSLLYCLLDTVQSCRAGNGNRGVAVIGVTTRIDAINLLEKRVKSRFSGRMLRTAGPCRLNNWIDIVRKILSSSICAAHQEEWLPMWTASVQRFLADPKVVSALDETFALIKDVRMLSQIMTNAILELAPSSPFPQPSQIYAAIANQRCHPDFHFLTGLPYPSLCLLIAAIHTQTSGHDIMNFEMLHEAFHNQVRASASAPVEVRGSGIGMLDCSRQVLMSAFEHLVSSRVFVCVAAPSANIRSEFVRYRCVVEREDLKKAIEKMGQTNLKKWFSKAQ